MAGHSKWANRKHRKAREDARRGKMFTKLSREIAVAAREGGGNPDSNIKLRLAIDKAKQYNMPNENIDRAIKRGLGELGGEVVERMQYEGYGPGGVALLLDIVTDNRNRAASEIRYIFNKHGGNLGESGCVSWMFDPKGLLIVEKGEGVDEETVMLVALEAGAEDVQEEDEAFVVTTRPDDFAKVREAFRQTGLPIASAEITMLPQNTVNVEGADAKKVMDLIEALEDHDDVQAVYANCDMDELVTEEVGA